MSTASWDLWDNIKKSGILVNVVSERGKRKTGMEKKICDEWLKISHILWKTDLQFKKPSEN